MWRSRLWLWVLLVCLSRSCLGQVDWDCVPSCKCIWGSGRKTAECSRKSLYHIPEGLSAEIQHLDMSSNRIQTLGENVFNNLNIINLQKLILRDNDIRRVDVRAFNNLKIVIEIDLTSNKIDRLHPGTFDETQRLRVLLLNNNFIKRLENHLFRNMEFLQKVELSNNQIHVIEDSAFQNLTGLTTLTLDGNNLTTLKHSTFEHLPKLGMLELRRNPWICNCHLKRFRDWVIHKKLYTRPTECSNTKGLQGKFWDEVPSDHFACRPIIKVLGHEIGMTEAQLWCRAAGIPRPDISWSYKGRQLSNGTRRQGTSKGYLIVESTDWSNLTILDVGPNDRGEYTCKAVSSGGTVENITTLVISNEGRRASFVGLPLAIAFGVIAFFFLLAALTLCFCYCRRKRTHHDEKSAEAASLDHHGLGEQEKSLITAINPVVKPPRRYEAPSVTSHGTEMTELNRTLLDNDSVFADGLGSVVGVVANGLTDDDRIRVGSPDEYGIVSSPVVGTLPRGTPYRQYPPDLLAFSGGRNSSPTSQASTAPDNSRLPMQVGFQGMISSGPSSPAGGIYNSPSFRTLPHPARASSATPYSVGNYHPPRYGFVTIPRRPRAPSWSCVPPLSPTERPESSEPVYDNLGRRTTADGSSTLSLNKSPEYSMTMRNRPLPLTPGSTPTNGIAQFRARVNLTLPNGGSGGSPSRKTPTPSQNLDRTGPEGAAEHPRKLRDLEAETKATKPIRKSPNLIQVNRKTPPKPPPKPKQKILSGPLYEDEGEDGTEV